MQRRDFVRTALAGAAGAAGLGAAPAFTMKFAPHLGQFAASAGDDVLAELRFMHEQGFRAVEDNLMRQRPVELQERVGREVKRLGMEFGLVSAMRRPGAPPNARRPQIGSSKAEDREGLVRDVRDTVEVARRVGARHMVVTPGQLDPGVEFELQMAAAVDTLRAAAKVLEPHGMVMVLEALNPWANHAGAFLTKSSQVFALCRAVDSPALKFLFDLYHLQISEGNLIANVDRCWGEIGYFQCGDVPGRKEPGTGEINYARVFEHIQNKGWRGFVGTEHEHAAPGAAGDQAVIAAYRRVDPKPAGAQGAPAGRAG